MSGTPKSARLAGVRVLLIDPDPRARATLARALEQHGARVVAVGVNEARGVITTPAHFDAVVCEDEIGEATCTELVQIDPAWKRVPLVLLTAKGRAEGAAVRGVARVLPKDVEPLKLVETLVEVVRGG